MKKLRYILSCMLLVALIFSLTACGGQGDSSSGEEFESAGAEEAPAESNEAESAQSIEDSAWLQEIFDGTMRDMEMEAGFIYEGGTDPFAFGFDRGHDYIPVFPEVDTHLQYVLMPYEIGEKVIVGRWSKGKFWVLADGGSSDKPRYYLIGTETEGERFADTLEECDTLFMIGDYEVSRQDGYYENDTDRVCTSTLVFVIDPKTKTLLHIEPLGVDEPNEFSTYSPAGAVKMNEAIVYINSMLEGEAVTGDL